MRDTRVLVQPQPSPVTVCVAIQSHPQLLRSLFLSFQGEENITWTREQCAPMSRSLKWFLPHLIVPARVLFPAELNHRWKLIELQSGDRTTRFLNQVITFETWILGSFGLTTQFQDFVQELKAWDKEKKFLKSSFRIVFSCCHKGEEKRCSHAKDDSHKKTSKLYFHMWCYYIFWMPWHLDYTRSSFILNWQLSDAKAAALSVNLNKICCQNERWCLLQWDRPFKPPATSSPNPDL